MPMYTVSSKAPLSLEQRLKVASLVTTVHCELTGAPPSFVNVIFSHGVPLKGNLSCHVFSFVRKGRPVALNNRLVKDLADKIAAILCVSESLIGVELCEVPASWIMEGGDILPEPGEEANCAWLEAANQASPPVLLAS
jgi:phenylpyruvate tautomerase PptA (4-oxalocrotonate tautomerase family)